MTDDVQQLDLDDGPNSDMKDDMAMSLFVSLFLPCGQAVASAATSAGQGDHPLRPQSLEVPLHSPFGHVAAYGLDHLSE